MCHKKDVKSMSYAIFGLNQETKLTRLSPTFRQCSGNQLGTADPDVPQLCLLLETCLMASGSSPPGDAA